MKKLVLILTLVSCSWSYSALAADDSESKSSLKIDEVSDQGNKVEGNIDTDVTNAKLRAESGSKSRYSLSLPLLYNGGSLSRPFGEDRPSLSAQPGDQVSSIAQLGINGRYRWSKNDSFTLGTYIGMLTPLQGRVKPNDQLDFADPTIAYNRVDKLAGFQVVGLLQYSYGTSLESTSINRQHFLMLQYDAMHAFQNGLSLGVGFEGDYYTFTNGAGTPGNSLTYDPGYYGNDLRTEWGIELAPLAEYAINDRYQLRAVFGYFNWKHLYGDPNQYRMLQRYLYNSVGLGIAVTRDIYLYPNVQFVPSNIRSDFTNVALNATINVF